MRRIRSWALVEIILGLAKTFGYLFKRKVTLNYPYEKDAYFRFRGEHAYDATLTGRSAALLVNYARLSALLKP